MGASGAIFGTHAAVLVDLIAHWSLFDRPVRMLIGLLVEIIIGFGLGFIPGIDNFSHIGGFALGLLLSIVLLPAVHQTKSHRWVMWAARIGALVGAIVMFAVLYNNFFKSDPNSACQWCRYLSCWPTDANNVSACRSRNLQTDVSQSALQGYGAYDNDNYTSRDFWYSQTECWTGSDLCRDVCSQSIAVRSAQEKRTKLNDHLRTRVRRLGGSRRLRRSRSGEIGSTCIHWGARCSLNHSAGTTANSNHAVYGVDYGQVNSPTGPSERGAQTNAVALHFCSRKDFDRLEGFLTS